jgi:hypothetical protein
MGSLPQGLMVKSKMMVGRKPDHHLAFCQNALCHYYLRGRADQGDGLARA